MCRLKEIFSSLAKGISRTLLLVYPFLQQQLAAFRAGFGLKKNFFITIRASFFMSFSTVSFVSWQRAPWLCLFFSAAFLKGFFDEGVDELKKPSTILRCSLPITALRLLTSSSSLSILRCLSNHRRQLFGAIVTDLTPFEDHQHGSIL